MSKEMAIICNTTEERRIWLGNLDPRLTEFQLLKIVQKCGAIEKFDMLFHKGGPLLGQSRGYAFVTFANTEGSLNAMDKLNGTLIAGRPIAVRLAKNVNYEDLDKPKPRIEIPALGTGKRHGKISKEDAIRAIEAKLKVLERRSEEDLELNTTNTASTSSQVPFIQRYQFNKDREPGGLNTSDHRHRHVASGRTYSKAGSGPYGRNQRSNRR